MAGGPSAAVPHSVFFHVKPPSVQPDVLTLKIPCAGKNIDVMSITVKNQSQDRIIYKMTPSKPHKFNIKPYNLIGFVDPYNSKKLDIHPKKLTNDNDFCKFDGFDIECAPAPKGSLWEPKTVWAAAQQIKRYNVKLKIEIEKKKETKKKPDKKKKEAEESEESEEEGEDSEDEE